MIPPFMTTVDDTRTLTPGGAVYRPPSEARSLLLQVTVGCSHNACTYCDMYRSKRFVVRPVAHVEALLKRYAQLPPAANGRVFLCDGDALILSQRRLEHILRMIRAYLPWVRRVSTYGDTRSVLRKSTEELRTLRRLGLGMVYHGVETGDDACLAAVVKGATRADIIETARRLKAAEIAHSVIVLLGIGGDVGSVRHAKATASLLTEIDPPYVGALTVNPVPGTPLHTAIARGEMRLPSKFEMLEELLVLIRDSKLTSCQFASNHVSNHLALRGHLPSQRDEMLATLESVLERRDPTELRPEWSRGH